MTNLFFLLSRCFRASARLVGFGFQHYRGGTGYSAIFSHAPKMNDHQDRRDDGNSNAMPDVGTQQRVRIDNRSTEQAEADDVIGSHPQHRAERAFVAE